MGDQTFTKTFTPSHTNRKKPFLNTMAVRRAPTRRVKRRRSKRVARRTTVRRARKPKILVGSMRKVWNGTADRTGGGLIKKDLMVNKRGKVVSRKSAAIGKKRFKSSGLGKWVAATQRHELNSASLALFHARREP